MTAAAEWTRNLPAAYLIGAARQQTRVIVGLRQLARRERGTVRGALLDSVNAAKARRAEFIRLARNNAEVEA